MGIFGGLKSRDINLALEDYRSTDNALLLDVRGAEEYAGGHIPGSINLPLHSIEDIDTVASGYEQKIFVYCLSGYRSRSAKELLNQMGYSNVENIGGFSQYSGPAEK